MSQSLYRKYRSQTFDELVGQEHVTRTLRNAVASGKIAHAYLFCGPRGTGKTSTARLLAKSVNCLSDGERPCNRCEACRSINEGRALDLIEIDAASRRKVEDIAEVIERVNFAPVELRYKVYIIDEVHMLTAHAFNALLKTLEEPPQTAIFILATTEVWKVLPTIISRCQRFDFRRIPAAEVVRRLEAVAQEEGLRVQPQALAAIARLSTGSLRDALGLLDQLTVYGEDEITLEQLRTLLGTVGGERVAQFVDALVERDAAAGLAHLDAWGQEGMDPRQFAQELVEYLRTMLLIKVSGERASGIDLTHEALESMRAQAGRITLHQLLDITERFSTLDYTLRTGPYGALPLELALVASTSSETVEQPQPAQQRQPAPAAAPARRERAPSYQPIERPRETASPQVPPPVVPEDEPPHPAEQAAPASSNGAGPEGRPVDLERVLQVWPRVLSSTQINKTIQALLRGCKPVGLEGTRVVLDFQYEFHKAKIEEPANSTAVEQALSRLLGEAATIRCTMGGSSQPAPPRPAGASTGDQVMAEPRVKAALDIYNGKIIEINGGEA
jgi:DNA polymerase-3 subunit gamma/tau